MQVLAPRKRVFPCPLSPTVICFDQQNVLEVMLWDFRTSASRDLEAFAVTFFGTHWNHGKKLVIKDPREKLSCPSFQLSYWGALMSDWGHVRLTRPPLTYQETRSSPSNVSFGQKDLGPWFFFPCTTNGCLKCLNLIICKLQLKGAWYSIVPLKLVHRHTQVHTRILTTSVWTARSSRIT